jgi:hypothetical protein
MTILNGLGLNSKFSFWVLNMKCLLTLYNKCSICLYTYYLVHTTYKIITLKPEIILIPNSFF